MKKQFCDHKTVSPCPKKVPIFSSLSDSEITRIAKMTKHKLYKKGEALLHEGEISNTLFIINKGKIKLSKMTIDGKEQILNILISGEFFGEGRLFHSNEVNNFSAYAIDDTEICMLTKNDFDLMLKANLNIAMKLLTVVTKRLAHTENLAQTLATKDPGVRIVQMILEFCEKFGNRSKEGIEIDLPLSREEIACYVGVTRETISRKFRILEDLGFIISMGNKRLIIKNELGLRQYSV